MKNKSQELVVLLEYYKKLEGSGGCKSQSNLNASEKVKLITEAIDKRANKLISHKIKNN